MVTKEINSDAQNQVKVAHISGRYSLAAAIVAAIVTGLFGFFLGNYSSDKISIDKYNALYNEHQGLLIEFDELNKNYIVQNNSNAQQDYQSGYESGKNDGYQEGYRKGLAENSENGMTSLLSNKSVKLEELGIWQKEGSGIGPIDFPVLTDNLDNRYFIYFTGGAKVSNTYRLNKEYQRFSATFAMAKSFNSTKHISDIFIYGDDVEIGHISITGGEEPKDFNVDVSNVNLLKIKIVTVTDTGRNVYSFMANAILE